MNILFAQQIKSLGLDPERPPTADEWVKLKTVISQTYDEAETARSQWKIAYDSLRIEMEGSFEVLRKSSADIISNERDKLQSIIRSLSEGLCALNENGCLLFMNPKAEELLGWRELDIRGQLLLDWLMPSAEKETTTDSVLAALRRGESIRQAESNFLHQDGHSFLVAYNLDPIMQKGAFIGAVLAFRDIRQYKEVERKRERQLQETLLLNRVIAATTSTLDLTDVLDTVCAELARFLDLPQAAFALLNDSKQFLTIVAEYLAHKEQVSALGEVIPVANNPATQEALRTKRPLYIEDAQNDPRQLPLHEMARKRGTRSILIVPLLVQEQVLGTLGLNSHEIRNFSASEIQLVQNVASAMTQALRNAELYTAVQQELAERRAAEQALAQARDKALEASRLKTELVAKVSHELRTPLTAILGFTEMIQLEVYGDINSEQNEVLSNILQSTDGLVMLVNDLLDVAQIEAGRLQIAEQPFKPNDVIERVQSTMNLLAEGRGLELKATLDEALPPLILGDGERSYQILVNLVSNAIKFTQEGMVHMRLMREEPDSWSLSVQDTGKGIPDNMHDLIFDQFQQVRFSPTREEGGIGLGLSIVKQLVTAMDGEITLESEIGKGSLFRVILPLKHVAALSDSVSN